MGDEENEVGLPQKGLNMIIKDIIPDMRVANEARDLLNQCCVEFIKIVGQEAQKMSQTDQRKTICHDHVRNALIKLGFSNDYVEAADSCLGECKLAAENKLKRKNSRLDKCGIPEEQLYMMQQQLIEEARQQEAQRAQEENDRIAAMGGETYREQCYMHTANQIMAAAKYGSDDEDYD
uniref:Protein Dr1 n=1 Tax=Parastrongyloides trichosuri TaxID=131310 RepID=A0A0N4ZRN3_PARTI